MNEFEKTKEFKTVFGTAKTTYVAPYTEEPSLFNGMKPKEIESHYIAVIMDGIWNGWGGKGVNRGNALADLLKQVANRYAHDICGSC